MKHLKMMKRKQLGQGMTEYIVIVALIAVAAIGAYSFFGETVRHQVAGLAQEISGTTNTETAVAQTTADTDAAGSAAVAADMGTFSDAAKAK